DVRAYLGPACRPALPGDIDPDVVVIIAKVARLRAGGEVDPFADVAMAQEAVVILVGEALHDARLDFTADAAFRADRRPAADLGAEHLRAGTDVARPFQPAEGMHDGAAI